MKTTVNHGGIRPGAGRKPGGKQTVTVRVPVELLPMIDEAKSTGLIPVTDNQDAELLARVQYLEKALKAQPHQCQAITGSGDQCANQAAHGITMSGYVVSLCAGHVKVMARVQ